MIDSFIHSFIHPFNPYFHYITHSFHFFEQTTHNYLKRLISITSSSSPISISSSAISGISDGIASISTSSSVIGVACFSLPFTPLPLAYTICSGFGADLYKYTAIERLITAKSKGSVSSVFSTIAEMIDVKTNAPADVIAFTTDERYFKIAEVTTPMYTSLPQNHTTKPTKAQ